MLQVFRRYATATGRRSVASRLTLGCVSPLLISIGGLWLAAVANLQHTAFALVPPSSGTWANCTWLYGLRKCAPAPQTPRRTTAAWYAKRVGVVFSLLASLGLPWLVLTIRHFCLTLNKFDYGYYRRTLSKCYSRTFENF